MRPDVIVVLGGPEVSHETDEQEIVRLADYVITGEADLAFAELCGQLLAGRRPLMKVIAAELPEFGAEGAAKGPRDEGQGAVREIGDGRSLPSSCIAVSPQSSPLLPYDLYDDHDIAHRVIYVEASRGCPFKCEFCLSSLDVPVRNVPLDAFLAAMRIAARSRVAAVQVCRSHVQPESNIQPADSAISSRPVSAGAVSAF